jgi:hypothetical protein
MPSAQVADLKAHSVSRFFAARDPESGSGQDDADSARAMQFGSFGGRRVIHALPLNLKVGPKKAGGRVGAVEDDVVSIRDALSHNIHECAAAEGIYSDTHPLDTLVVHAIKLLEHAADGRRRLPPLSLIRVDAEGFDGAVIQGAMGLINNQKPVVIFEAEYRDGRNLSHFSKWEYSMAECAASSSSAMSTFNILRRYSASEGIGDVPQLLLDMVADVLGTESTVQALQSLLCDAAVTYTCYAAFCPVR